MHLRIENIIKCIYPDLIHEPSLTKPIKNFKPDTAIPSIKTLIEYKFITNKNDAKKVTDEILADTRAYSSKEWSNLLFVVYETNRIKHEKEWKQLIHECKAAKGTEIIVLSGEQPVQR